MTGDPAGVWNTLATRSAGFAEQVLLRGAAADMPRLGLGDVGVLIGELAADDDYSRVTRMLDVTIEGRRSPALKPLVLGAPPGSGESIEDWSKRVFAGRTFSVMVNAAERWSDTVARAAAEFFAPARESFGIPQHTYRVSLFLGDYGFTPSGVHRDIGRNERVVHLNLGPGRKAFYSWPVETYRRLTGSLRPSYDPEPLLPHASADTMEPGDALLLNVSRFHVGRSDELAATLGLEMSKMSAADVAQEAAAAALGELFNGADDPVRAPGFQPEPVDYTDLGWAGLPASGLDEWLSGAVAAYTARQRSNLGLSLSPMPRTGVDPDALAGSTVRLAAPFPLVLRERDDRCDLYIRGRCVTVPRDDAVIGLVERLGSGGEYAVTDLLGTGERERRLGLGLLSAAVRLRGVDAAPAAERT